MGRLGDFLTSLQHNRSDQTRREALRRKFTDYITTHNLSTIPGILARINRLCQDPDADVDDFVKIYQMDKSSSARLVRMANSVLYATDRHATADIREAVLRIGFNGARELLHASTVCGFYKAHQSVGSYSAVELWKHSMAVAITSRLVFSSIPSPSPEIDPYLAGLLHDIGISIAHACLYHDGFAEAMQMTQQESCSLLTAEENKMGLTHPEIGADLAQLWNFPPLLTAIIRHHHHPETAPVEARPLIHSLRTAEWLCREAQLGYCDISDNDEPGYRQSMYQTGMDDPTLQNKIKQQLNTEFQAMDFLGWFTGLHIRQ